MKQQEKGRGKLDIRALFTLAAIAEILGTLLIATLLTALLENLLHEAIEVHPLVWLLLFGTTIGLTAATVVNVLLLRPVVRLSRAMKQVASGNFAVRLTTNSVINEIADSYDSFNRMVEALGETETLQTDFVSNVSHEIKTPVSAIEGLHDAAAKHGCFAGAGRVYRADSAQHAASVHTGGQHSAAQQGQQSHDADEADMLSAGRADSSGNCAAGSTVVA